MVFQFKLPQQISCHNNSSLVRWQDNANYKIQGYLEETRTSNIIFHPHQDRFKMWHMCQTFSLRVRNSYLASGYFFLYCFILNSHMSLCIKQARDLASALGSTTFIQLLRFGLNDMCEVYYSFCSLFYICIFCYLFFWFLSQCFICWIPAFPLQIILLLIT